METSLKQRLLGAALLIALAVIFIPMLFDGAEREEPVALDMDVPPEPEYAFEKPSRSAPGGILERRSQPPARATQGRASPGEVAGLNRIPAKPAGDTRAESGPDETLAAEQRQTAGSTQAAAPEPSQDATRTAKPDAPAEQVAIVQPPAGQPVDKPQAASTPKPSPAPAAPTPSASVPPVAAQTESSSPSALTAWAVQVGSFSEHDNATSLRNQLRESGFAAFEERIVSEGEPVFRVKVGPELNREQAEALQVKLRNREDLKGIVVSHPNNATDR